jgi:PKD repeat protein
MLKNLILFLFILCFQDIKAQVFLNHNIGEDLVDSGMTSCEEDESWGKVFNLSDFGVTTNEQFIVRSIEVGINRSYNGANLQYQVFSVDKNFPETDPVLLGYGGFMLLPQIDTPEIIRFDLEDPIVVPSGVESIMIVIGKTVDSYNPNSAEVIIAGTQEDRGESYYIGCRKYYSYVSTNDLEDPVPNANFFIRANGEIFSNYTSGANTTLSQSVCDNLIKPYTTGCNYGGMSWSREYLLSDFGIAANEEFVINSGQIGLQGVGWGVTVEFRIYKIDDNFPDSFTETDLIGSSQVVPVPYFVSNAQLPKIVHVDFEEPVVVPAGVERILVEVYNGGNYAFPASTAQDSGISWFRSYSGGCRPFGEFVDIKELGFPDTKIYLTVTGNVNNISGQFGMNITNTCSEFLTEFSLTNPAAVASVLWNFGDPASGAENTSADLSPFHDFSADGTYTITATVKGKDGSVETITETIHAKEPPMAYGVSDLEACEITSGSGISTFNTSGIRSQVLGNQTNKVVTFIDGSGTTYDVLPDPFTNTVKDRETITVRVAREEELCCFSETTFDLIVNPLPDLSEIEDLFLCGNDNEGFAIFDLTPIEADLSANNTSIDFFFQDGEQIPATQLEEVTNRIKDLEIITVKVTNTLTGCYEEATFIIGVTGPPVAKNLEDLTGCDDNDDGISEYFNTSQVEAQVLGDQTGMEVSYFTEAGNQISNPLPNPYTNTNANEEIITVRVTNPQTGCFAETSLKLITSSKPRVNEPATLYACDSGNGSATFDTSNIEEQIIGNQTGLLIFYFDENGDQLSNFSSSSFTNTVPYEQLIMARIEDPNSTACATEITFSLKTVVSTRYQPGGEL